MHAQPARLSFRRLGGSLQERAALTSAGTDSGSDTDPDETPETLRTVTRPLPRVLVVHTGGTLGMDPGQSYHIDASGKPVLAAGTGGKYSGGLRPGTMLKSLLKVVPELSSIANLDLKVAFNLDSSRIGPEQWIALAQLLDTNRQQYDAFLVVHGTDTMAYTAAALSFMLAGFKKPIVLTGSQLPLLLPRSDARQNLVDSLTVAVDTPPHNRLSEVAICFGGKLLRGNRAQKVHSSSYQAFASPSYPELAIMGVETEWRPNFLLQPHGAYSPRSELDPAVMRIPIVPGTDPRQSYGDLSGRGVHGIVLEAFGAGNMPDAEHHQWLPWLKQQREAGLQVYLSSQCQKGGLQPDLYASGSGAMAMGCEAGPLMTPECAGVKMMFSLRYPDIKLGWPLAGEM
jgi:L-asparaginase type I